MCGLESRVGSRVPQGQEQAGRESCGWESLSSQSHSSLLPPFASILEIFLAECGPRTPVVPTCVRPGFASPFFWVLCLS